MILFYYRYFHIPHNTPCLPPKILHNHRLQFLLGRLYYPGEMENKGYPDFGGQKRCIMGNVEMDMLDTFYLSSFFPRVTLTKYMFRATAKCNVNR